MSMNTDLYNYVNLHLFAGDQSSFFLSLDSISSKSVLLYDRMNYSSQHRLYPNLTFTCNGTIDNITFLATYPMAGSDTFPLPFSLWSTEDNSTWNRQGGRVVTRDEQSQCEEDDKLCILSVFNAGLKFEAGYQFGVLLNGAARRYDLIHLSGGGLSFYTPRMPGQTNNIRTLTFNKIDGAVPLLTIDTGNVHNKINVCYLVHRLQITRSVCRVSSVKRC